MGRMQDLFVRSATLFQVMMATLVADLYQHLQRNDLQAAAAMLHGSKGNAATLGLVRLAAALQDLERLCKTQDRIEAVSGLALTLEPVVQTAQDALRQDILELEQPECAPDASLVVPRGDAEAAMRLLQLRLMPLLASSDLAVLDTFDQTKVDLMALPQDQLGQLAALLQALKLSEALPLCQHIVAEGNAAA